MSEFCSICPRKCNIDREKARGFCGMGEDAVVARAAPHFWEEPCISGENGSGTVFFSGCNLRCVFCQNHDISRGGTGKAVSVERLREIYAELIAKGVHNINLVTASHFLRPVLSSLSPQLPVPVVWNSSGYEDVSSLKALDGKVQIYLPDMKYSDSAAAKRYSAAPDYPEKAKSAILEMFRQTGPYVMGEDGLMKSGVIIRHLVLPGNPENTYGVIDWVAETFSPGDVLFSLMSQFTPYGDMSEYPEIDRRITAEEYDAAVHYMRVRGITDGFYQELSSAREEYTPDFDLTGV